MSSQIAINHPPILINTMQNSAVLSALDTVSHELICVNDHAHMIEDWQTTRARLVIVDSVALCEQIRSDIPVPIIVISDDIDGALAAGADDCLPMHARLLAKRVTMLLNRQPSHAIYDHIPAMISVIDADDHLIYVNDFWLNRLGYDREEVIGQSPGAVMSDMSRQVMPRILTSFRKTQQFHTIAFRFVKKNGEKLDVLADSVPLEDGQILIILRDISELQAAERSLRSSRNELMSILRALPDTVLVVELTGTIIHVVSEDQTPEYMNFASTAGRHLSDILPVAAADRLSQAILDATQGNDRQVIEFELDNQGQTYYFQAIISPVNFRETVVVIRDTTHSKQMEATLIESEKNYRRLFENATDAIFVIDVMTGNILQASPQASIMLGYSQRELLAMQIDTIESNQIAIQDQPELDVFNTDKLTVETQYRRRDGSLIDVEITSRVILQSKQLILISFVRNISERKRTLAEVQRQRNIARALLDTANVLNETDDLDTVLHSILSSVHRVMPCDSANIMLIVEDTAQVICHLGYDTGRFTDDEIDRITLPLKETGNLDWIVDFKQPLRVNDTAHSSHFNRVDPTTQHYVKSLLTAPIIRDGQVIGFINLDSQETFTFSQEQEKQLMAFANQAAIAIQRTNMIQKLHAYTDHLERRVDERTREIREANRHLEAVQIELASERNLLQLIIDNIPDAIYVKDTDHRFLMANTATISNMEGVESEVDIIGKTDADFYPHRAEQIMREEKQIMETRTPQLKRSEIFQNPDGRTVHLLVSKVPMIDAGGHVTGIIGLNQDITRLNEAETRLEQVVNSARCLLWSATVRLNPADETTYTWQYRVVNEDAAHEFLPLERGDLSYTDAWLSMISRQDQQRRKTAFHMALQDDKTTYGLEYALHTGDDLLYWLNEEVLIERISESVYTVTGVCNDITARKVVEEQLKNLNEDLEVRVAVRTLELSEANSQLVRQIQETEKAETAERDQRIIAEALRDGIAQLATTHDRNTIFDRMLTLMQTVIPHDASSILLLDGDRIEVVHSQGYNGKNVGLQLSLDDLPNLQIAIREARPTIIQDTQHYEKWKDMPHTKWIRSLMTIPIITGSNIVGFISLDSKNANHFTQQQAQWLISFGEQVGLAILNARYTTDLEAMVRERTQQLEFEQAQLRAILNGVTDGVVYTDMERRVNYINRAMADITGFEESEWLDGSAQIILNSNDDNTDSDLETRWRRILRWLETNSVWTDESELVRKDRSTFDAGISRTLVRNQAGKAVGVVTVVRDVSDEKRLAEQKARFITKAAHELRTPIANLKTRLFLIKRRPDKIQEHLSVADTVINLMQNLVEHMFDLSRFERGIIEPAYEEFELQSLLRDVIHFQMPQAERMSIALKLDLPEQPIQINADPFRLTQVITNLIGNALKYAGSNSDVTVKLETEDTYVLLDVIDHGEGIPEEHLEKLFQPFYQASENQTGVGLGLTIVQEIVHAHGGMISVDSKVGHGTTFHVRLPLQPDTQNTRQLP